MRASSRIIAALALPALTAGLVGLGPLGVSASANAASPTTTVPATFAFAGGGWGHGVGMSQYGALGMASEGRTANEILEHYYTGTKVGAYRDDAKVRVNLAHRAERVRLRTEALASGGGSISFNTGSAKMHGTASDRFSVRVSGTGLAVHKNGTKALTGSSVVIKWSGTRSLPVTPADDTKAALLNLVSGSTGFGSAGHRFRYGYVKVMARTSGGVTRLEAVNAVSLHDEYLLGIGEMPSSWPAAALQAQVIAARSYALVKVGHGVRSACQCHVDSGRGPYYDQVFSGYAKESGAMGSAWRAAVKATNVSAATSRTVLYAGKPAQAFYSSSTGGRTQDVRDVWGGTLPYLKSVDDHWSSDPRYNPTFASWGPLARSQAQVAKAFGLRDVVRVDLSDRYVSGALRDATAWSSKGEKATLSATTFVVRLGLTSNWVRRAETQYAGTTFSVAVKVGRTTAPASKTVVLAPAGATSSWRAFLAAPLAARKNAPLLLSGPKGLPAAVKRDVRRRGVTRAYLVGGRAQLGRGVVADLRARGVAVTRLSARGRHDLSVTIARAMGVTARTPVVVTAANDPASQLAAAAYAARLERPLLFVTRDAVPASVAAYLSTARPSASLVVGPAARVSAATAGRLPKASRAGGSTSSAVSVAVAKRFGSEHASASAVLVDPDRVGAASTLPTIGVPVLITDDALARGVRSWLQRTPSIGRVRVVPGVVSASALVGARQA